MIIPFAPLQLSKLWAVTNGVGLTFQSGCLDACKMKAFPITTIKFKFTMSFYTWLNLDVVTDASLLFYTVWKITLQMFDLWLSFVGHFQAAVCVYNGKIFAIGGSGTWNCLNSVEVYDPMTNTWEVYSSLNTPRRGAGADIINGKCMTNFVRKLAGENLSYPIFKILIQPRKF